MAKKPKAKKNNSNTRRYGDILYEVKDQVAWLTINRPRVLNAFREQTLDELIDALRSTREDPSIACAVVSHEVCASTWRILFTLRSRSVAEAVIACSQAVRNSSTVSPK